MKRSVKTEDEGTESFSVIMLKMLKLPIPIRRQFSRRETKCKGLNKRKIISVNVNPRGNGCLCGLSYVRCFWKTWHHRAPSTAGHCSDLSFVKSLHCLLFMPCSLIFNYSHARGMQLAQRGSTQEGSVTLNVHSPCHDLGLCQSLLVLGSQMADIHDVMPCLICAFVGFYVYLLDSPLWIFLLFDHFQIWMGFFGQKRILHTLQEMSPIDKFLADTWSISLTFHMTRSLT